MTRRLELKRGWVRRSAISHQQPVPESYASPTVSSNVDADDGEEMDPRLKGCDPKLVDGSGGSVDSGDPILVTLPTQFAKKNRGRTGHLSKRRQTAHWTTYKGTRVMLFGPPGAEPAADPVGKRGQQCNLPCVSLDCLTSKWMTALFCCRFCGANPLCLYKRSDSYCCRSWKKASVQRMKTRCRTRETGQDYKSDDNPRRWARSSSWTTRDVGWNVPVRYWTKGLMEWECGVSQARMILNFGGYSVRE
jgi:hypothetical protein